MAESAAPSRPLSPHLQIWRFTITMASSITHRATGVANIAGAGLLAVWLFTAAQGPGAFGPVSGVLASPAGGVILVGFIWSLAFHLLNGLRYLYWDSGRGFALPTARATAWAVYAGSAALTALVVVLGLAARGA